MEGRGMEGRGMEGRGVSGVRARGLVPWQDQGMSGSLSLALALGSGLAAHCLLAAPCVELGALASRLLLRDPSAALGLDGLESRRCLPRRLARLDFPYLGARLS